MLTFKQRPPLPVIYTGSEVGHLRTDCRSCRMSLVGQEGLFYFVDDLNDVDGYWVIDCPWCGKSNAWLGR